MSKVYVVQDSNGNYAHEYSMGMVSKDWDNPRSGKEYFYYACQWANRGSQHRESAERTVEKLRKMNEIIGFEGLDWKVVCLEDWSKEIREGELVFLYKDVPRGRVTAHRKAFKAINKTYVARGNVVVA